MKSMTWFGCVMAAGCAATVAISMVPHPEKEKPIEVQRCGENAGWIEAPPGHIACTLKNGQVINLRSVK